MKKKVLCLVVFFLFFVSFSVQAAELNYYTNVFTDETSIEEDFENLNMDISDYYQPSYNYGKWYVVGMSEGYADTESFDIQTYFYIYNPVDPKRYEYWYQDNDDVGEEHFNYISHFRLEYKLLGNEEHYLSEVLSVNYEHHIYKVKSFTYEFLEKAEIEILSIQNFMTSGLGYKSESAFKSSCNHSKLNGFNVELYFNSTLIIDEYTVAEIEVHKDDNFLNGWENFWTNSDTTMLLYFYNFNFPDHIDYDEVIYAKFQYDYLTYYQEEYVMESSKNKLELKEREKVISEYDNTSKTLRVNKNSQELTFPTFYLGNRIKDKQFGTLKITGNVTESTFDYDCSVLLDSTYKAKKGISGQMLGVAVNVGWKYDYTTLDQIEMLELHYKSAEVIYKCQVVTKPVENEDFEKGNAVSDKPWWDKFLEFLIKMFDFIFYDLFKFSFWAPKMAKYITSGIILFVSLFFVIPKSIKWTVKLVKALFGR